MVLRPRTGGWIALLTLVALVAGACTQDQTAASASSDDETPFQAVPLADGTPKPDFTLIDTDGNEFDFIEETAGSTTLLFFGFTNCPDICPPHLAQIAAVLKKPDSPTNVRVVFVTVDPDRDSPEVIRRFLDNFSTSFIGLTGDIEAIEEAQRQAGVSVAIRQDPDDNGNYTVAHSGEMRAYAPNGLGYVTFPFGTRQSQFSHDLALLDRLRTLDDQP